jgi:hypothetical protein
MPAMDHTMRRPSASNGAPICRGDRFLRRRAPLAPTRLSRGATHSPTRVGLPERRCSPSVADGYFDPSSDSRSSILTSVGPFLTVVARTAGLPW